MRLARSVRLVAAWLWLALATICTTAWADTPVTLFKSFAGNVNFTGTEVTMRTNKTVCDAYSSTTQLSKALTGIPAGAQIVSAHLYWAGSGSTYDYQVSFDGINVTAQRQYAGTFAANGTYYTYFGGAADVTAQVKAKGNGTYTFTGLTINTGSPYCAAEGVLGGFSLLVVYSDPVTQPFRVLNIYEGFQFTRYSSITLNLSNFKTPNPLGSATGRVGHITWEGDLALNQQGEDLSFNGTILTDSMNPAGNQFNSQSNINGDTASYGIDFDAYTIGSPIIQGGQTTASTVYSSGQDLVLLNAEIIAVPNVPVADLSLGMARSGDPIGGQNVVYTLSVKNNGPNAETGPITVTDTLPAGMSYVSASGTGWACSHSGQVVTCTYNGSLANGAVLQPITVTALVSLSGSGTYANTASVAGNSFDNVTGNNTATDTSTDPTMATGAAVFTIGECTAGVRIGTGCKRFTGPLTAEVAQSLYVTALDANGVPVAMNSKSNKNSSVAMKFSLSCLNPVAYAPNQPVSANINSSVTASFSLALPACTSKSAPDPATSTGWSPTVQVWYFGLNPSGRLSDNSPLVFSYADVGLVMLNLAYDTTASHVVSARFISQPAKLVFDSISQTVGGALNPWVASGSVPGFVAAGEKFTIAVKALTSKGNTAYNYGNEIVPQAPGFIQSSAGPAIQGSFAGASNGVFKGTAFTYDDIGDLVLAPMIDTPAQDYLGAGSQYQIPGDTVTVGRFYPAYFTTGPIAKFVCKPHMLCPTGALASGEALAVNGAVYSAQSFDVPIKAFGLAGNELTSYAGALAQPITLSVVNKPGDTGAAVTAGTLSGTALDPASAAWPTATPTFSFPAAYAFNGSAPSAMNWIAPTTIYVRATANPNRAGDATARISSNRKTSAVSMEGGLQVVTGRVQLANAFGSELIKLPVKLTAQYWTGSAWENNSEDSDSVLPASAAFTSCKGALNTGGGACVPLVPLNSVSLAKGAGTMWLQAPGAGKTGSASMQLKTTPTWLPSTIGRVTFGVYKSTFIYIREVY